MSISHPSSAPKNIEARKAKFDTALQKYLIRLATMKGYTGAENVVSKATPRGQRPVLTGAPPAIAARVVFESIRYSNFKLGLDTDNTLAVLRDNIHGDIPNLEMKKGCLVWNRGEGISIMALESLGFSDEWIEAFERFHKQKVGKIYFKLGSGCHIDNETRHTVSTLAEEIEEIVRANPEITIVDVLQISTRTIDDILAALHQGKLKGISFFRTLIDGMEAIAPDVVVESLYRGVHVGCAQATGNFMQGGPGEQPCATERGKETPIDPKKVN